MGGQRGRLEGARPRCAWRRLARDRDPPHARGPANGHPSRTRRGSPPSSRPPHSTLRVDLAYPGSRGRGRRGPALTERSATPLDARVVRAALKPLPKDAGKEARGRVLIVGGSLRYPGATLLASRAALRCGAGVVTVAAARTVVETIAGEDPNVTFFPLAESQPGVVATGAAAQLSTVAGERIRALLIGPGLAHAPGTDDFVIAVLRNARSTPTVVDADGLNALARTEGWRELLPTKTILTPHDGEAARLAGRVVPAGAARVTFAERHARDWGAILVLKGPVTVVSDGKKTYVHDQPNPTLGVGGSGDALGGAVAAFLARGLVPLAAAAAAVWVHGRAGGLLASEVGESGALATDIVEALPRALREIVERR
ncbi:MAG: NAD(P)H-hydrate dehydratase [Chloroflexi bacterium]|nr:MAG: NAD(P)H-hydrate dehydratase [Chloroflexota bacterium]